MRINVHALLDRYDVVSLPLQKKKRMTPAPPIGCLFSVSSLYVWSATQLLGWVLPIFFTLLAHYRDPVTNQWVAEMFLVAYSYYVCFSLFLLYIFQIALQQLQPDPFCPYLTTYGVPALTPFYVGCAIGLTLLLPIFLEFSYSLFTGITILCCIWIAPAATLIWFSIFTASQVALSLGIGVLITLLFILMFKFYWVPYMPYMLNVAPFTWLGVVETWFSDKNQQERAYKVRECRERLALGKRWPLCC
jgi:hypothetical protein